jgi:hypothetical protein
VDFFHLQGWIQCLTGATVKHVQRINNIFILILHKSYFYSAREKRLEANEVTDRERSGTSTEMREGASEGVVSIASKFSPLWDRKTSNNEQGV